MTRLTRKAFTLIELLVVISIISLLIAILLPALRSARESARKISCSTNQRQLAMLQIVYEQDNGEFSLAYIPGGSPPSGFSMAAPSQWWYNTWMYYLVKSQPGYIVPTSNGTIYSQLTKTIFHCPQNPNYNINDPQPSLAATDSSWMTYGMNWHLGAEMKHNNTASWRNGAGYKSDMIAMPSSTLMFIDFVGHPVLREGLPYFDRTPGSVRVLYPHLGSANVAFADGHATTLDEKSGRAAAYVSYSKSIICDSPRMIVEKPATITY